MLSIACCIVCFEISILLDSIGRYYLPLITTISQYPDSFSMIAFRLLRPCIAVNMILSLALFRSSLSYHLPTRNLTLADAKTETISEENYSRHISTPEPSPISLNYPCSAPLIDHQAPTDDLAVEDISKTISSLIRRGIGVPAVPATPLPLAATAMPTPTGPARLTGPAWFAAGVLAILLILLTGLLAGLTLGVMSVDMTRLRVWTRTGSEERR